MSTSSTTYSRHRKRNIGRSSEETINSRDFYSEGGREQVPSRKWSTNKLKQEISHFIAEFSYLTDNSNKTDPVSRDQSNINSPRKNVQVYTARREQTSTPFENPEVKRRGVEWNDQQRGAVMYSAHDARKPSRGRVRRAIIKHRPRLGVSKSRSAKHSNSRDLSCPQQTRSKKRVRRRFSGFRASKSRSQRSSRGRRARSSRSETPVRRRVRSRHRRRIRTPSCSRSYVRFMPFRFPGRRRTREIVIKKSKPKIIYKTIEPKAEPTLVTLYPKPTPIKRRPRRLPSREPGLPCKCDMCRSKYQALTRLYCDPRFNAGAMPCLPICAPYPPICSPYPPICAPCPPICAPCPPIRSPCPPKCQVIPRDCSPCSPNWNCNGGFPGGGMCNRAWPNQRFFKDCHQPLASRCVRSVCFNFGVTGQCLDSNITHYFNSILDRGACC